MTPSRRAVVGAALACTGLAAAGYGPARAVGRLTLRRGINAYPWFSLTREYPAPRTDYAWPPWQAGRPVPTPATLTVLRRIGLDFVRIPVDPGPFVASAPDRRDSLLDDLAAAVGQVLAADLSAVVNIQANAATHHWTPERFYGAPDAPGLAAYQDLVAAVAGRLGRLDQARVALEPVNEPPQACDAVSWRVIQTGLLRAARQAAPRLTLIATGGCGSMIPGLLALEPAMLETFAPLLFTFHFYEPYLFTHQGAPWMREPVYRDLNAVPWPASAGSLERTLAAVRARMAEDTETSPEARRSAYAETERVLKVYFDAGPDRRFIDRYLQQVAGWCERHGVARDRVLLGEFGALRTDERSRAAPRSDRLRYIADVRAGAEAFGFPWAMWSLFDAMGLMDGVTQDLDRGVVEALGLALPPSGPGLPPG